MNLITPDFGLIFWQTIILLVVLFILKKYAWKPILTSIKNREQTIETALQNAKKTTVEIANMQKKSQKIIEEATKKKNQLIQEAIDTKKKIIQEAKQEASLVHEQLLNKAKISIAEEQRNAIHAMKKQVVMLSIQITEKILRQQLTEEKTREILMQQLVKEA